MRAGFRASWIGVAVLLARCYSADPASTREDDPAAADDGGALEPVTDAESARDADAALEAGPSGDADTTRDAGSAMEDASWSGEFGPPPPQNPFTARDGLATQHGDSAASDTSPLPGPGAGTVRAKRVDLV